PTSSKLSASVGRSGPESLPMKQVGSLFYSSRLKTRLCLQSRFNCRLDGLIRIVGNALAVDVNRRRAVDAKLMPIHHVALNLLRKLAAVERCIEPSAIETKLTRILPELVNAQC